jgi:hypothetical protein
MYSPYTGILQKEKGPKKNIGFSLVPLNAVKYCPKYRSVQGYAIQYMLMSTEEQLCYVSEDVKTVNHAWPIIHLFIRLIERGLVVHYQGMWAIRLMACQSVYSREI